MKNILHYQISDYDCGPTSIINGLIYLFEREELVPEIIHSINNLLLDRYGTDGVSGKRGTSAIAMKHLSEWLNEFKETGRLDIQSSFIEHEEVYIGENSTINFVIEHGGTVITRLFLDEWHYVTITNIKDNKVYLFDPYYTDEPIKDNEYRIINNHPYEYNRIIPAKWLNRIEEECYAFGPYEHRDAVIIYNTNTMKK